MAFERLVSVSRLNPGRGTFIAHQDHELAVFLLDDPAGIVVIDNACPHASGNLSGGVVANKTVTCPWHDWTFDLETGVCTHSDLARVMRYPAEIRDAAVWVDLGGG